MPPDELPDELPAHLAAGLGVRLMAVHRHDPDGGAAASAWVAELPDRVAALRRRWRLGPLRLITAGFAVVAACERDDGTRCVLKLGVPGTEQPRREVHWLRRVADTPSSSSAVALLDAAPDAGAQLLARVEPGETLQDHLLAAVAVGSPPSGAALEGADDEACDVLAAAAAGVRCPALPEDAGVLPTLTAQLEELFEQERTAAVPGGPPGSSPLPRRLVGAAAGTARQLLATSPPDALLHGDLHHANVLRDAAPAARGRRGWTVIDPHGLVGDPAHELACSVYNPFELGDLVAPRAVARCERLAAASGLPPDRVRGWALVQAVLSAVWFLDTGDDGAAPTRHVLGVAERLAG